MIRSYSICLVALLAGTTCLAPLAPAFAQGTSAPQMSDLRAEIADLEKEISKSEAAASKYDGGALAAMANLNTQTLRLTKSLLEARVAAQETGAPIEIKVPAVKPDPDLAAKILGEIQKQQKTVNDALKEAQDAGGLMGALAMTRYETEKLTLAQLRQGWLCAQYGIAFPGGAQQAAQVKAAPDQPQSPQDAKPGVAWADPDHPEIDYSTAIFASLHDSDYVMSGWWGIQHSKAAIDDSPEVVAMNVSNYGEGFAMHHPSLIVGCIEHEARVIYDTDEYLLSDFNSHRMQVTVRVDDADARNESWSELTTSEGAGLFGAKAEAFIRELRGAKKLFLRLRERNNSSHDLELDLAGSGRVFKDTAGACGFSLLALKREDYRAIQALLNAGGFDAGTPDGVWGAGSSKAMRSYQAANGLKETGAPDEETLKAMGIEISG